MYKKFTDIINKLINFTYSERFKNYFILLTTLLALTFILSSLNFMFHNIIEDGVSKVNVIAKDKLVVEDIEKTEAKKRYESLKVKTVLRPIQDNINELMDKKLGELISSIKEVKDSEYSSLEKRKKFKILLGINEDDYFVNKAIDYIDNSSEQTFSKIAGESLSTLDGILVRGVTENDLLEDKNKIIEQNISKNFFGTQKSAVMLFVEKVLEPNMEEDKNATELAIHKVISSVSPVVSVYEKGDLIVSSGERVKQVQKDALKKAGYNVNQLDFIGIVGIFSLVGLCIFTTVYFIVNFENKYIKPSYTGLIAIITVLISLLAVMLPDKVSPYIIPIPAVALLLTIFTSSRIALLVTMLIIIMLGVSIQYPIEYIFVFMLGAIIAIFTSNTINYYRRMDMVRAGFDVGLIQMFIVLVMFLLQNNKESLDIGLMVVKMFMGFGNGLISGMITLGIIPLIESTFKIITPYGLAELSDHNQTLLRRLQFEAPGTYHHSLMVSNLCEAAAEAIGANPILVRVAAFYHDIGKLKRPLFFIENQSYFGIENPHETLNPKLSKMVITAHPKDGVELAREYGLPPIIHQFIIQHHGDGLAAYFYKQALEAEGPENVSEDQFRYNNPRPSSKEAAILMLADAVESAVRSLKNPEPEEVDEMVEKIIQERLIDGQLSDSPLTQKDVKMIGGVFKRALRGMQHHRIKYHEDILEELNKKSFNGANASNGVKNG